MNSSILKTFSDILQSRLSDADETGCKIYNGPIKKSGATQYGIIRKTINHVPYEFYAHRIAKMAAMNCTTIEPPLQCSHLCHNSLCCNPEHIVLETQTINNNRIFCKNFQYCTGHTDINGKALPNCIF